jgi:uncharacterized membrane protein
MSIDSFKDIANINTIFLLLIFAIIYCFNYCDPIGLLCAAFSQTICMIIGYAIVEMFLSCLIEPEETALLINSVLLISIVLVFVQRIVGFVFEPVVCNYDKKPIEISVNKQN